MKTLNITLIAFALASTAATSALALDGPRTSAPVALQNTFSQTTVAPASANLDATSAATLRLNVAADSRTR